MDKWDPETDEEYKELVEVRKRLIQDLNTAELRIEAYVNRQELLERFRELLTVAKETAAEDQHVANQQINELIDDFRTLKNQETRQRVLNLICQSLRHTPTLLRQIAFEFPEEALPILVDFDGVAVEVWGEIIYSNPELFNQIDERRKTDFQFLSRLVMFNPKVYLHYLEAAKANRKVQLSFLKACAEFDIAINECAELFEPIVSSLEDRAFIREAVARYPLITYLAPREYLEEPKFAYELFSINPEAVKPLYLSLADCSDSIDQAKVGAELKAKVELKQFNEQTPQGKPSTRSKDKI